MFFWIVVGVIVISLVVFCCLYRNIKLAIAIIKVRAQIPHGARPGMFLVSARCSWHSPAVPDCHLLPLLWNYLLLSAVFPDLSQLPSAQLKTATVFVVDVPLVMFVPMIFTIITAAWWAFWIATMLNLYSYGYLYKSNTGPWANIDHTFDKEKALRYRPALNPNATYADLKWNCWYFLFGGLWVNAFISAVCQFTLAVITPSYLPTRAPPFQRTNQTSPPLIVWDPDSILPTRWPNSH